MCLHDPCESCGENYDACFHECPECGHPNKDGGQLIIIEGMPQSYTIMPNVKKVYCKLCECDHTVTIFERVY